MRLNYKVVDEKKERMPGGIFGGQGEWDVFQCTLEGKEQTASFILALNSKEHQIDIQPIHPKDRKKLISAFNRAFAFQGSRQ